MGRKSSLTADQWIDVERRHLVNGESIRSLAKEYGVDEAAIRRRISPQKSARGQTAKSLLSLAKEKIQVEEKAKEISAEIAALPVARQHIVSDITRKLTSISHHLGSAAEYGAATAHRLAGIANSKVAEIDDAAPMTDKSMETLKGIAVLTKMANESSEIGINLLRANKDAVDDLNKASATKAPSGLIHFYGDS